MCSLLHFSATKSQSSTTVGVSSQYKINALNALLSRLLTKRLINFKGNKIEADLVIKDW